MEKADLFNIFIHDETLWSLHFPGKHKPIPQKTYLKKKDIEAHLNGEKTISVQLLHPVQDVVKAGCFDIDVDEDNILSALESAKKIKKFTDYNGIDTYLEFSGRRGFHVWVFVDGVIDAAILRRFFLYILSNVNETAEIFPPGDSISLVSSTNGKLKWDGDSYKPIKLPYGKHQNGGWSGFVDWDFIDIDEMSFIDIDVFFKNVKKIPIQIIEEIASLHHEYGIPVLPEQNLNFSLFESNHPDCINALLRKGAPHDINYNAANVILGRYCNSRGLSDDDAIGLGKAMALSTGKQQQKHPTTKKLRDKISDFNGVWKHIKKHQDQYVWNCSYVFFSKTMLSDQWCSGWNCPFYPHKKEAAEIPQETAADSAIESDVVQFIIQNPEDSLSYGNIEEIPPEGFISKIKLSEKVKKLLPVYQYLFDVCLVLIGHGYEVRKSTILHEFKTQKRFEKYEPYLSDLVDGIIDDLLSGKACTPETFKKEIQIIHERGVRILARQELMTANKALFKRDGGMPQALSVIETLRTGMLNRGEHLNDVFYVSKIHDLLKVLRNRVSLSISTGFKPLDDKLAGGFQARFYVFTGLPGGGKSTFLAQIAYYASKCKIPVLYLQYEMSTNDMFLNYLSMQTGIDSTVIEQADWNSVKGSAYWDSIAEAAQRQFQDLKYFQLLECGKDDTVYTIRSHIQRWKQKFSRLYDDDISEERFLVIVDSTNHVTTGNSKIDSDDTQCSSWVGSELARMTRPSDTNTTIIGINELTKQGYKDVIKSGHSDMSSLRGSFRVSHSAHAIAIIKNGLTEDGRDQIDVIYEEDFSQTLRKKYPITDPMTQTYSSLEFLKNRSGQLGSVLFFHEKAAHRFIPITFNGELSNLSNNRKGIEDIHDEQPAF